ncbi:Gfo/Idh/MocA family protein [Aureliella helgolandensis]|uniref:Gfo/Idh/MocA family protein n=1 Tax=Aureliella helgolandensis TaxID=2527968 RepID=UPI0011A7AF63|nr:Gfo/Idh/MocA family oxidoreductase [Aureliella helgolandensis]
MTATYRIAGISFEHMHMGDNLRTAAAHPECQVVGICDAEPRRMLAAQRDLELPDSAVFNDWTQCIEQCKPDILLLCPATGDHRLWIERLAPFGLPILLEKPMAGSLADADAMISACQRHDVRWAINWPQVWVPSHRTAKRLSGEGAIGQVLEVHYYGGNRGPLWHTAGKDEVSAEEVAREKPHSWFYQRAKAGGSMLDYLGYGATLGTWYLGGAKPIEITSMVDEPTGLEVDEHSITIARYAFGLSKFETRWGTYTDPWTHQPQPRCGYTLVGTEGTITSWDYSPTLRVQDGAHPEGIDVPVDSLLPPEQNAMQYFIDCLKRDRAIEGPLSPELSRIGQQIVDTAFASAQQKRTLKLLE